MLTKTELFPYQQEAAAKLLPLRIGALYMEMGTGKTRTALELIQRRLDKGKLQKVLWLCPCSVKDNLAVDLDKHSDGWKDVITIHGIESLSSSDRLFLELLKSDYQMMIVDESNLVKNFFAKRTKRITELGKKARYRLILNGTPVSKNEADLYAQWFFLDYRIFGYRTFWSFAANHLERDDQGRVKRVLDIEYLTNKIKPYSVMIKKKDVLKLPEKVTYRHRFDLTRDQEKHYQDVADYLLLMADPDDPSALYRTFTALQLITSGRRITSCGIPLRSEPFFKTPTDNPRIQALMDIIPHEKCLIWVKFQHEAEEIKLVLPEGSYAEFTGKVKLKERKQSIEAFRSDPECLYLIANKSCGGYGLNLQFCHQAIYYNNDFSYATRAQAEDRIHRIGQSHTVELTDVVSSGRIDQRIIDCLDRKSSLSEEFKRNLRNDKGREFLV